MKRKEKGFTLTELMIVVVILATMAALVVPRLTGQPERGAVAEAVAHLAAIRQAEAAYSLENSGAYTNAWADLDFDQPTGGKFTYEIAVTGTVTAKRVTDGCVDKTITLDKDGNWGGTHPYGPKYNAANTCT